MARKVRDADLDTRTARLRLAQKRKPHWRRIDPGRHLGYYKGSGKRGGSWIARYFLGEGRYKERRLGLADDIEDADGFSVLTFSQAQAKAREWFAEIARHLSGHERHGPYTVSDAIDQYLEDYKARGRSYYDVKRRIDAFILPELGTEEVSDLTSKKLRKWFNKLATSPPRLRTGRGQEQRHREQDKDDPDVRRRRQASANKILTILKAALNYAWREGEVSSDKAWRAVKPFRDVEAARPRYLSPKDAKRLVNACEPDFRDLVRGALYTGCRYGELVQMQVRDYNTDAHTILIRYSKSGKPRDVALTDEGVALFDRLTAGRGSRQRMFLRDDGTLWGKSHQNRRLALACAAAKIDPPISFHGLRHCYGSWLALRGVSLQVIAKALGHADTRITEKHYAHLSPDHVAKTVRAHLPPLGVKESDKVVPLDRAV